MEHAQSPLPEPPDIDHIVTEDDTPVDNIASEKQQRLLTEPLYSSWAGPAPGVPFIAAANVGVFPSVHRPPIVPDVFVSLDVEVPEDWWAKRHRTYFVWEFGKVPEVVLEIVSNRVGGEADRKRRDYARMGVPYYIVYDPQGLVQEEPLRVYARTGTAYRSRPDASLPEINLGLTLWEGLFEGKRTTWLRWCDGSGQLIPTGAERAEKERQRAEKERQRAEKERQRADEAQQQAENAQQQAENAQQQAKNAQQQAQEERQRADETAIELEQAERRADKLAAQLRALGVDLDGG